MGKMNVDPLITFSDGSQLLVSTQHSGEGRFTCELFVFHPNQRNNEGGDLRSVSNRLEAQTCNQAQINACFQARRLFPNNAPTIREPPYLVWPGPNEPVAPDSRWGIPR